MTRLSNWKAFRVFHPSGACGASAPTIPPEAPAPIRTASISRTFAPRRAQAVAGVVAISGRLLAPERLADEAVVRPPVLLIHGDEDAVVPFADMQAAGNALVAAGFQTYGHVMQGTGHGIAPDGLGAALQFLREELPL